MSKATSISAIGASLVLLLLSSSALSAQGLVTGIRISNFQSETLDATFDVTLNTSSPSDSYSYTGFLGNRFALYTTFSTSYTSTTSGGTGTGTMSSQRSRTETLNQPVVNAIEFGDGDVVTATTIPAVISGTPGSYVGSFSHTYPAPGPYTIRVATTQPVDTDGVTTGSSVVVPALSTISRSIASSSQIYTHTPSSSTFDTSFSTAYTTSYSSTAKSIVVGLSNTADVTVGGVLSIPVLSGWSLLLLISSLAGAGLWLLRR